MKVAELFLELGIVANKADFAGAMASINGLIGAARAVASAFDSAVGGAANVATEIGRMSTGIGMGVEAFQEFSYLAEQSGSSATQFATSIGQLERTLRTFAQGGGGKGLAAAMSEIGMSADDARKALASPEGLDSALLVMADRFMAMGDTPERAALALKLFGRGARGVLDELGRGSAGVLELRKHFRELGAEMSGGQVAALRALRTQMVDLHVAWDGFRNKAVAALAPMLTTVLHVVQDLAATLGGALATASQVIQDHWVELTALVVGLTAAFVALRAEALITGLIALAPFVLLGAIIGALVLIVNDLWVGFHDHGRSVLLDLWQAAVDWAAGSNSSIASVIKFIDNLITKIEIAVDRFKEFKRLAGALNPEHYAEKKALEAVSEKAHERAAKEYATAQAYSDAIAQMDKLGLKSFGGLTREEAVRQQAFANQMGKTAGAKADEADASRKQLARDYGESDDKLLGGGHLPKIATRALEDSKDPWRYTRDLPAEAGKVETHVENHIAITVPPGAPAKEIAETVVLAIEAKFRAAAGSLAASAIPGGKVR